MLAEFFGGEALRSIKAEGLKALAGDCRPKPTSLPRKTAGPSSAARPSAPSATTSAPGFTEGTSGSVDGVQQTTTSARAVAAAYDSIETLAQPFDLAKAA